MNLKKRLAILGVLLFGGCSNPVEPANPRPLEPEVPDLPVSDPGAADPLRLLGAPFLESSTLRVEDGEAFPLLTWYVNGAPQVGAPRELTGAYFDKGDVVTCEAVRYVDGMRDVRHCARVQIANSPPALDFARLAPGSRMPWETFRALPEGWDDADGDLPQYRFGWSVNGVPQAETSATFQSLALIPGDLVSALVVPYDGETLGKAVWSEPVVIAPIETPVEIALFAVSASAVVTGRPVEVSWATVGAEACTLLNEAIAPELLSGGLQTFSPQASTNIALTCFGSGGPVTASVMVTVLPEPPAILMFEPVFPVIDYGEATALVWATEQADGCSLDGSAVSVTSVTVAPIVETVYTLVCSGAGGTVTATTEIAVRRPRINEIAWMGTLADPNDEWIELYNPALSEIDMEGWRLRAADGTPDLVFDAVFPGGGYWLFERTNDDTVPGIAADRIFTGGLSNAGEGLDLLDAYGRIVDSVPAGAWFAGDSVSKAAMERIGPGTSPAAWASSTVPYAGGLGTPRLPNSKLGYPLGGTSLTGLRVWAAAHHTAAMPAHGPGAMTAGLIEALDGAKQRIEFALYGVQGSLELRAALQRAVARGVTVNGVVDADRAGWHAYRDTQAFIAELPPGAVRQDDSDALMHNKFVVIDRKRVWTGSANWSDADVNAEYNCNAAILIDSAPLAEAFAAEAAQMYAGKFHRAKQPQAQVAFPRLSGGTLLEAYFAPLGDARRNAIIRAIDAANLSIDATIFFLTDVAVAEALLAAHRRGVAVRLIVDAVGAAHPASLHRRLRSEGVPVKTEPWGGKAHSKVLLADGYVSVLGSQNWTEAGNRENDENTLYVENAPLHAALAAHFQEDWDAIPSTWLTADPRAESADSPGTLTDLLDNDSDGLVDEGAPEQLAYVNHAEGAINAYFNKSALRQYAAAGNPANFNIDLAARFLVRLNAVTQSVDMTAYELNEERLVQGLIDKAAQGVPVRLVVDGKAPPPLDPVAVTRYQRMRLALERMARGADGLLGTQDDVHMLADSPVWAVEESDLRAAVGLPADASDLPLRTAWIGNSEQTGRLLADAERKPDGATYYAAGEQMHNKFAVFDRKWVWAGSWNPVTDGTPLVTTDQIVEFHDPGFAQAFAAHFEVMWGGGAAAPNPLNSRFHGRKPAVPVQSFLIGGRRVEVVFSPGGDMLGRLRRLAAEASSAAYFSTFAWSDQGLVDILKEKWEASDEPGVGALTGFQLAGVFNRAFWDQWWSASADMRGRESLHPTEVRAWAHRPPVVSDGEDRTLHTKVMVLDPGTPGAVVAFGSANWGDNGNFVNDDHLVIVYDQALADQFMQHFWARYFMAGGRLP